MLFRVGLQLGQFFSTGYQGTFARGVQGIKDVCDLALGYVGASRLSLFWLKLFGSKGFGFDLKVVCNFAYDLGSGRVAVAFPGVDCGPRDRKRFGHFGDVGVALFAG